MLLFKVFPATSYYIQGNTNLGWQNEVEGEDANTGKTCEWYVVGVLRRIYD